jgi:hypothetical protein
MMDLNRENDLPFRRSPRKSIVVDPVTGLPVLSAGPDASRLSSKQVREILSEFP